MRAIQASTLSWQSAAASSRWPGAQALMHYGQALIPGGLNGLGDAAYDAAAQAACGSAGSPPAAMLTCIANYVKNHPPESAPVDIVGAGLTVDPPPPGGGSVPTKNAFNADPASVCAGRGTGAAYLDCITAVTAAQNNPTPIATPVAKRPAPSFDPSSFVPSKSMLDTTGLPNGAAPGAGVTPDLTSTNYAATASSGIPTWVWILGGLVLAGGTAAFFFRGKK